MQEKVLELLNEQSAYQRHKDKSDEISTGWACQFAHTTGKSGKDRKSNHPQQKVYYITDQSSLPSKEIQFKVDHKVGQ